MPYRYEDLDDKRFQSLAQALLAIEHPGLVCMPVGAGQTDGGRDAVLRPGNDDLQKVIYQVKWEARDDPPSDPAVWIRKIVAGEDANIKRLVLEGAKQYIIVTSVRGTATRGNGTMDKAERELDKLSKQYKIPMQCYWRQTVDVWMDKAPDTLKWKYADCLVGHDALRAMLSNLRLSGAVERQARVVRDLANTEWVDDENLRFKQAGLDSIELTSLFVDVLTVRERAGVDGVSIHSAQRLAEDGAPIGAAEMLLEQPPARSTFLGAPGQGKSTLLQYVCQVYRAQLLDRRDFLDATGVKARSVQPRVPLKIDLRDYAEWVEGRNPFAEEGASTRRPPGAGVTVEGFLSFLVSEKIGEDVTVQDVKDIIDRYPCFLAFDGLDEVANGRTRARVVNEIEKAVSRFEGSKSSGVAVVTARPSYDELPQPNTKSFTYFRLLPLDERLRLDYMRLWLKLRDLSAADRRSVQRVFRERSGEPHIRELSTNPMQLAILLYLVHQRADSVPTNRTELYKDYMKRYLDRESVKDASVSEYRELLVEVTSFLGWHMQALSESGDNGRLKINDLKRKMRHFLADLGKDTTLVDILFTAAVTRVWVLTSRVQGYFEFDVQPVREFFAAQHLSLTAPPSSRMGRADKFGRFMELALRPYWLNTARFMAGFFSSGELSTIVDEFDEQLSTGTHGVWLRRVMITLLSDGVFDGRPRVVKRAVHSTHTKVGILLHVHDLASQESRGLPADRGGDDLARLLISILESGGAEITVPGAQLLRAHSPDRDPLFKWWSDKLLNGGNTGDDRRYWLEIGIHLNLIKVLPPDIIAGIARDPSLSPLLVAGAAVIAPDSSAEGVVLGEVCEGSNIDMGASGSSFPSDVSSAFNPIFFIEKVDPGMRLSSRIKGCTPPVTELSTQRSSVVARVKRRSAEWARAADAMRISKGQSGTTSAWSNTARSIESALGRPCWLAREIALIGAASVDLQVGGDIDTTAEPFGAGSDPAMLVREIKFQRNKPNWWSAWPERLESNLDRAVWLLALVTCAGEASVKANLEQMNQVVKVVPDHLLARIESASLRIGSADIARKVSADLAVSAASNNNYIGALLLPHVAFKQWSFLVEGRARFAVNSLNGHPSLAYSLLRIVASGRTVPGRKSQSSVLDLVEIVGPRLDLGGLALNLSGDEVRRVLSKPEKFPFELVLQVEKELAPLTLLPPLQRVADDEGWFDEND